MSFKSPVFTKAYQHAKRCTGDRSEQHHFAASESLVNCIRLPRVDLDSGVSLLFLQSSRLCVHVSLSVPLSIPLVCLNLGIKSKVLVVISHQDKPYVRMSYASSYISDITRIIGDVCIIIAFVSKNPSPTVKVLCLNASSNYLDFNHNEFFEYINDLVSASSPWFLLSLVKDDEEPLISSLMKIGHSTYITLSPMKNHTPSLVYPAIWSHPKSRDSMFFVYYTYMNVPRPRTISFSNDG